MHSTPGSIRKLKTRRSKLWPPARRGAAHLSQAQGCRLHESQLLPEKWWCSHRHHHHHGHQRYIESRRGCLQTPRGSGSPSWVFMKGGTFMCRIWLLHMLQGTNQGNQSESCPNHGPPPERPLAASTIVKQPPAAPKMTLLLPPPPTLLVAPPPPVVFTPPDVPPELAEAAVRTKKRQRVKEEERVYKKTKTHNVCRQCGSADIPSSRRRATRASRDIRTALQVLRHTMTS